jgi:hypothetical protein
VRNHALVGRPKRIWRSNHSQLGQQILFDDYHGCGIIDTTGWTSVCSTGVHDFYSKPKHIIPLVRQGETMPESVAADIASVPEELEVTSQPTAVKTKIGEKDFCEKIGKIFSEGKPWRTPQALAKTLEVDVQELVVWMDKQAELCCRPGKEDGTYFYALVNRLEKVTNNDEKSKNMVRPVITEEDRYLFAQLHLEYKNITDTLEKYALRIHDKSEEAFNALASAKNKMSAGLGILANALKVDTHKLPKL